jgi:hypothetical protein
MSWMLDTIDWCRGSAYRRRNVKMAELHTGSVNLLCSAAFRIIPARVLFTVLDFTLFTASVVTAIAVENMVDELKTN